MKYITTFCCLFLLSNLTPKIVKAQKNEISILPARIYFDSFSGDLEFAYAFQYVEFERKLNNKLSLNAGLGFKSTKRETANFSYKDQESIFGGGAKYYFNKKNNMSGFYTGIALFREQYKYNSRGNSDDFNSNVKEFYRTFNYLFSEISSGYKYCFLKNRISIDLSLKTNVLLLTNIKQETIYFDNTKAVVKNSNNNWGISVPFMDLRIGYRFGFKK